MHFGLAPASRIISLILREVVPRTTLSSTRITRLPSDQGAVDVELQTHAHVADLLAGLDEGAAHVLVADDPHGEGDAGFLAAKPMAAGVPLSGTGQTRSASTGASRASSTPIWRRVS